MKTSLNTADARQAVAAPEAQQSRAEFGIEDHRAATTAQRKRQEMADASARTRQLMAVRQMASTAQLGKKVTRRKPRKQAGIRKPSRFDVSKNEEPFVEVHTLAPDCHIQLHVRVPNEIKNYAAWLRDELTWAERTDKVKEKRNEALQVLNEAEALYKGASEIFPNKVLARWSRTEARDYANANTGPIRQVVDEIRSRLVQIDTLVKEPPVPPKSWNTFMGSRKKTYHKGTSSDPIPVVWYKNESDYAPIKIRGTTYRYPNGPTVQGRLGKYALQVSSGYRFQHGSILKNEKMTETRLVQVDINWALKQAGASLAGLDGDHVTDLGFGGKDTSTNYWPLVANVNRRPFLGWRSNYGVNYINSSNQHATAALGALAGKYLKIKAFMSPGEGNVPAEGARPDEKAGTDET